MLYNLYVLKQGYGPGRMFKNHWALFVHDGAGNPNMRNAVGTYIHVTGGLAEGFTFEVRRNWSQAYTSLVHRFFLVGRVTDAAAALWPPIDKINFVDLQAKTVLEKALLTVAAPGPSRSGGGRFGGSPVEMRDCQWWVCEALPYAVQAGHVELREDAPEILNIQNQ